MSKFSKMILDSLKVTDDDDEFEDDDNELKERQEKRERQREERKAAFSKKEAPAMRRNESENFEDDYDEEEDSLAKARAERAEKLRRKSESNDQRTSSAGSQRQAQPAPQYRSAPPMRSSSSGSTDVCILRPKRFEECQEIIDVLKSGRVIFLTFDSTNPAIANRIMDFSFGAVYALDAQIIQLSGNNFVIAPEDAEISGEYINSLTAANYGSWNNTDANGKR